MLEKQRTSNRTMNARTGKFLLYLQLSVIAATLIWLFVLYFLNIALGLFDLPTIAMVSSSILTVLVFIDFLILLPPKQWSTNFLGLSFSIITLIPIALAFFCPSILTNEWAPLAFPYFYLLFYAYWNLTMYQEHEETIKKEHPQVAILLQERGLFFMAYAYTLVISFILPKLFSVENTLFRINYLVIALAFFLMGWKPMAGLVRFRYYLRKTKEGRKLRFKSYGDKWKENIQKKQS